MICYARPAHCREQQELEQTNTLHKQEREVVRDLLLEKERNDATPRSIRYHEQQEKSKTGANII